MPTDSPELAQVANGMAKLGWKVPIIASWPASMQSFIDIAGFQIGIRFQN